MLKLDHLTVIAPTLAEGVAHVRSCLGLEVPFGQRHAYMGTHNHLLQLGDGVYLEIVAVDPDAAGPGRPRWFGLDDQQAVRADWDAGRRLRGWVAGTDRIDMVLARREGTFGRKVSLPSSDPTFEFSLLDDGSLPLGGAAPSIIDRRGKARAMATMADLGARLRSFSLEHPEADAISALYRELAIERAPSVSHGGGLRYRARIETPGGMRELSRRRWQPALHSPRAVMRKDWIEAFPAAQRETARAALAGAFGPAQIDTVTPVGGGASGALPYRVEVGGRPYLLRIEGKASPLRNPHQYHALRIAAASGIAPVVHHIDEVARVVVTDFIAHRPLQTYPGGPAALVVAIGALLARLQEGPVFPHFVDYPDIVGRLFAHVRRTGLFADGLLDAHFERLGRISQAYAGGLDRLVASHNDLIPGNILFDGQRLWLIDWESAYRNDPLVDVATVLDTLATAPALEAAFLRAWLGRAPDADLLTRLELTRALTRLYYAGVMLSGSAAAGRAAPDTDLSCPSLEDFRQAIADGLLTPGTVETRHLLGKMFLASFLTGAEPPGFEHAVLA